MKVTLIASIFYTFMLSFYVKLKTVLSGYLIIKPVAGIFDTFMRWLYVILKTVISVYLIVTLNTGIGTCVFSYLMPF